MTLPYHLGNGWFGGLLPVIASTLVAAFAPTKTTPSPLGPNYIYIGLSFPIIVALMTVVVGSLYLKESKGEHFEGAGTESRTGADPLPVSTSPVTQGK